MFAFDITYVAIKLAFLLGLVRSFVVFDPLKKHWLFLAILYTAMVSALCWVYFNWREGFTIERFQHWAVVTLIGSAIYFKLLARLEGGMFFWLVLLGGLAGLVYY